MRDTFFYMLSFHVYTTNRFNIDSNQLSSSSLILSSPRLLSCDRSPYDLKPMHLEYYRRNGSLYLSLMTSLLAIWCPLKWTVWLCLSLLTWTERFLQLPKLSSPRHPFGEWSSRRGVHHCMPSTQVCLQPGDGRCGG